MYWVSVGDALAEHFKVVVTRRAGKWDHQRQGLGRLKNWTAFTQ